ncbi:hypothetical protein E1287_14185 [Actinomadura sp. KC06]|uniref:hypothetical protein n=1 Tax=Actinomadura sp. KC06 TaxID=2530369 RepID=UPI00104C45BE|nr:hypothetical protein [Actinomadura sp. KC06]TDD35257.1 hypothetical protein E1287_14185 [Actinomadura sp. KC06]
MSEVKVGAYRLVEDKGMWFLLGDDEWIAGTLVPQPDGSWRCRIPGAGVRSITPPDGVPNAAAWVARQVAADDRP